MKTLETFLNELTASEELQKEFTSAKTKAEATAFLKAHDCDATVEEVAKALQATAEGEISDEDAEAAAGGMALKKKNGSGTRIYIGGKWWDPGEFAAWVNTLP